MNLYIVRHGESEFNAKDLHQHQEVPLSKRGVAQANFLAKRLKDTPFDVIISSPFKRAKQTAEIVNSNHNKRICFSSLFSEYRRPSVFTGKNYDDPQISGIKKQIIENFENPDWRHSDEENFFDFRLRVTKGLTYLEKIEAKNALLVTHGDFIKILICIMLRGEELKPLEYRSFRKFFSSKNTGVTIAQREKKNWKLITWNDLAHLADPLS